MGTHRQRKKRSGVRRELLENTAEFADRVVTHFGVLIDQYAEAIAVCTVLLAAVDRGAPPAAADFAAHGLSFDLAQVRAALPEAAKITTLRAYVDEQRAILATLRRPPVDAHGSHHQ
jgi:hypothetical protein